MTVLDGQFLYLVFEFTRAPRISQVIHSQLPTIFIVNSSFQSFFKGMSATFAGSSCSNVSPCTFLCNLPRKWRLFGLWTVGWTKETICRCHFALWEIVISIFQTISTFYRLHNHWILKKESWNIHMEGNTYFSKHGLKICVGLILFYRDWHQMKVIQL